MSKIDKFVNISTYIIKIILAIGIAVSVLIHRWDMAAGQGAILMALELQEIAMAIREKPPVEIHTTNIKLPAAGTTSKTDEDDINGS